jgi:trehalose 6-phosphate synthase
VQSYQQIRQRLEAESGRINGKHAELDWTPIRYINKQYERRILMSLFRTAQIGYVTPLRDGMNLVAKEYVAAQDPENPGVLVLSRFAGAAHELDAALIVNPYDTRGMAEALNRALTMPLEERKARYAHMMERLHAGNLTLWRERFLADLRSAPAR